MTRAWPTVSRGALIKRSIGGDSTIGLLAEGNPVARDQSPLEQTSETRAFVVRPLSFSRLARSADEPLTRRGPFRVGQIDVLWFGLSTHDYGTYRVLGNDG